MEGYQSEIQRFIYYNPIQLPTNFLHYPNLFTNARADHNQTHVLSKNPCNS